LLRSRRNRVTKPPSSPSKWVKTGRPPPVKAPGGPAAEETPVDIAYAMPFLPRVEAAEETVWLRAARLGESWALERFYHSYQTQIYALCRRLLGGAEDARDATQVTFMRAFRELPRFRGESSARTWLYRIAVNESLTMLRKRRESPLPVDEESEPAREPEILQRLTVQSALERTRPAHRTILVLRFWEGLSYEEISGVLGITLSATKMRLKRARDEFRVCYGEML
jgi:RNA polymerase sigma-70 factor (ECF subfamily)